MDTHDLFVALDRFVSDNKSHHILERRWLALVVNQVRNIALGLKTGGVKALSDQDQQRIRQFRLGEIAAAKADLAKKHAALDKEAAELDKEHDAVAAAAGVTVGKADAA